MLEELKETAFPDNKDFTRPTFIRKTGEIGIFIDIYDAQPIDKTLFGSRQYFLMSLIERFYKEVCQGELFKIKGFFFKRNLLHDVTLEYFHPGILMIINTNSRAALDELMIQYENGKLNDAFYECFVTEKLQTKLEVKNLKLKIKIFSDEIEVVQEEWQMKFLPQPYVISGSKKDMRMIYIVKKFQQRSLFRQLGKLKEEDSKYETNISEFLVYLKHHCRINQQPIKNIHDAQSLSKEFSTIQEAQAQFYLFQNYIKIISDIQRIVRDTETHVLFSLSQIRIGCESEGQRDVNINIQKKISNLKASLKDKAHFKFYHHQIESLIPNCDRNIWAGMIFFIPSAVSMLSDIDQQIDDYFQLGNFHQVLKEYENKHQK